MSVEGRDFPEPGEAAARLHMIGLALLVLLGAAGMVLKIAFDFVAYFSGPARRTLILACLLALVVGAAFLVLMTWYRFMQPPARLGDALFLRLFEGVKAIEKPGLWSWGTYQVLTRATHIAVVLAIAAMVTGSISCLAKFPDLDEKENWNLIISDAIPEATDPLVHGVGAVSKPAAVWQEITDGNTRPCICPTRRSRDRRNAD